MKHAIALLDNGHSFPIYDVELSDNSELDIYGNPFPIGLFPPLYSPRVHSIVFEITWFACSSGESCDAPEPSEVVACDAKAGAK